MGYTETSPAELEIEAKIDALTPPRLECETIGEWLTRTGLPNAFVPYFPFGNMVDWQAELYSRPGTIMLYPYASLTVGKHNETLVVPYASVEQVTEASRAFLLRFAAGYGYEHAEQAIPSVERLQALVAHSLTRTRRP